jgi:hypothetical protein
MYTRSGLPGKIILLSSAFLVFLAAAPAAVQPVFAYPDPEWDPVIYSGNFFILLDEAGPFDFQEYDEQKALRQLLEEARFVFSAMIYGFSFEYVPYDSARGIAEEFNIESVHMIPWGDSGLKLKDGRYENGRYSADISYTLSEDQLPWAASWDSNIFPEVISRGEGSFYKGFEGKIESIKNAVKQAARDYLTQRIYNKPRRITGKARLNTVPVITVDSGKYSSRTGVTLQLDGISGYEIY